MNVLLVGSIAAKDASFAANREESLPAEPREGFSTVLGPTATPAGVNQAL